MEIRGIASDFLSAEYAEFIYERIITVSISPFT
jgi:hypothetical protein